MPPTPNQIREQLLNAIDQDAKVINMVGVLEAIACLENIQITKEALEETRLGKIVNDIRKNTEDSALSVRCKKLVRVWSKQFVRGSPSAGKTASSSTQDATTNRQPTPPTQGTTSAQSSGGNRTPSLKTQTSTTPSSSSTVDKKKSENRKRRKLSTSPSTASPTGSATTSAKKLRPAASTPISNATKEQTNQETKNGMSAQREGSRSDLQSSKSAFSKVKPPEHKASSRTGSPALKVTGQSSPDLSKLNANTSKAHSKSPLLTKHTSSPVIGSKLSPAVVGSDKAGRSSPSVKAKQPRCSNSTDSNRLDVTDSTALTGERTQGTTHKDSAATNRLQSKSPNTHNTLQDSNSSSATVKLRSPAASVEERCATPTHTACCAPYISHDHMLPESQSSDQVLQETDSSRVSFSIFDDDYDEEDETLSEERYDRATVDFEKVPAVTSSLTQKADTDRPPSSNLVDDALPGADLEVDGQPMDAPEALPTQDAHVHLEEEPAPARPVTADDLTRVHSQQWDGVNGCYSDRNEWSDWTQCLSITTQDDNALHILPYICLD
ncbi:mediator of RNA polymerase II transcription subunit 26-like isoform X2 [Acanthaster planci]|uniref:Mediator of RNA polymerase II transcription subunit 26 n=1 Tax=Acanthaster planci TaxID=133434 RepID=A0A8B7ZW07_ACAPL|nr:mediator of RNA polymerase II transcription subunit 26-like isoform X2 [Acanthaster planci]